MSSVLKLQGVHYHGRFMRAMANLQLGQSTAAMSDLSQVGPSAALVLVVAAVFDLVRLQLVSELEKRLGVGKHAAAGGHGPQLSTLDKHRLFNLLRETYANRGGVMCVCGGG